MNIAAQKLTPTVTTGALPASRKIHIAGEQHPDIRVPMREISLHPTSGEPPVIVYDASGPYTDPDHVVAIEAGLPRLRESWIAARDDTEGYEGRHIRPEDNGFATGERLTPEFPVRNHPRRAKDGKAILSEIVSARTRPLSFRSSGTKASPSSRALCGEEMSAGRPAIAMAPRLSPSLAPKMVSRISVRPEPRRPPIPKISPG